MTGARRPEQIASRTAYEAWHKQVQSADAVADRPWHELVLQYLRAADVDGRTILEIGCGRGELAVRLAAGIAQGQPRTVFGVDFSQAAVGFGLERARNTAGIRAVFTAADIHAVPFGDGSFDTVISCETVEHVSDPHRATRELYRVLRPGGRLLLTTPNYFGPYGAYRVYLRMRGKRYTEGDQPICHFTTLPRTAWWLQRAGFSLTHVDAAGHYVLRRGRIPEESAFMARHARWFWPFGLHSIVVCEKPLSS